MATQAHVAHVDCNRSPGLCQEAWASVLSSVPKLEVLCRTSCAQARTSWASVPNFLGFCAKLELLGLLLGLLCPS